jgi:hypothetical protein
VAKPFWRKMSGEKAKIRQDRFHPRLFQFTINKSYLIGHYTGYRYNAGTNFKTEFLTPKVGGVRINTHTQTLRFTEVQAKIVLTSDLYIFI